MREEGDRHMLGHQDLSRDQLVVHFVTSHKGCSANHETNQKQATCVRADHWHQSAESNMQKPQSIPSGQLVQDWEENVGIALEKVYRFQKFLGSSTTEYQIDTDQGTVTFKLTDPKAAPNGEIVISAQWLGMHTSHVCPRTPHAHAHHYTTPRTLHTHITYTLPFVFSIVTLFSSLSSSFFSPQASSTRKHRDSSGWTPRNHTTSHLRQTCLSSHNCAPHTHTYQNSPPTPLPRSKSTQTAWGSSASLTVTVMRCLLCRT